MEITIFDLARLGVCCLRDAVTNGWQTVSARADLATFKKFAPFDEDWFLIRMVSLVRHIYIRSPIGVKNVKRIY
jgi:ribosomal protein S19E (S16A)